MNNILTVITVHSIKSDTTYQLSKKMREEENRIISLVLCEFEMYLKLACPPVTLFNRTGTLCECTFFPVCTVIYFSPSWFIHCAGFTDSHLNLSYPMHEGHHRYSGY